MVEGSLLGGGREVRVSVEDEGWDCLRGVHQNHVRHSADAHSIVIAANYSAADVMLRIGPDKIGSSIRYITNLFHYKMLHRAEVTFLAGW